MAIPPSNIQSTSGFAVYLKETNNKILNKNSSGVSITSTGTFSHIKELNVKNYKVICI